MSVTNKDSIVKVLLLSFAAIVGLWLIYTLFFNQAHIMNNGFNYHFNNHYGGGYVNMGMGYGAASFVPAILLLLIKVLFVIFIIGLVVGIAKVVKDNLFTSEDIQQLKGTFTNTFQSSKVTCSGCGKELHPGWKACPYCGKEKEIQIETTKENISEK